MNYLVQIKIILHLLFQLHHGNQQINYM